MNLNTEPWFPAALWFAGKVVVVVIGIGVITDILIKRLASQLASKHKGE